MERIEFRDISEFDGKQIISHHYYLSIEERNHITEILKHPKEENTKEFIDHIELDLGMALNIQHNWNQGSHDDQIKRLDGMIKRIEGASKYILQICSGRIKPIPHRQCNFLVEWTLEERRNRRDSRSSINSEAGRNARIARPAIKALIENLKSARQMEKLKRGRPRTDELELVFQIAKRFKQFIGPPRPNAGPFREICDYCFEIIGIKISSEPTRPTRAIRQALQKLSSSQSTKTVCQKST
jgi:hypothetical protein